MLEDVGMKAFSYGASYLADPSCLDSPGGPNCDLFSDDVAAPWGENMWSTKGRGDINTMATFGANAVRLYGNDPRFSKEGFFDELIKHKMKAVAGLSNYPYSQAPVNCQKDKQFNCYQTIVDAYAPVLTTGGYAKDGYYHNAIEIISLMNEPDLALLGFQDWDKGNNYIKAMVSAFDGFLTAEKNAGIKKWNNGKLPKITAMWSDNPITSKMVDNLCSAKGYFKDPATECGAGVCFMAQFYHAIQDPEGTVKYTPTNDLKTAYQERWVHGWNTFRDTDAIKKDVLPALQTVESLKGRKVVIGEFDPAINYCGNEPFCDNYGQTKLDKDLTTFTQDADFKKAMYGASFFEFQAPYDKNDPHERAYGMFGLTAKAPWNTGYIEGDAAKNHPVNCLTWKALPLGKAIVSVFGGKVPDISCPSTVSHDEQTKETTVV
jgi:hypothetical protein